jgi:hypothetical protein
VSLLEKVAVVWELVKNCCGGGMGTIQEPREKEHPPMEAGNRRLVKIQ